MRGDERVIAPWHEHRVAVVHRVRLVERAVAGVHALDPEALGSSDAVGVDLLEHDLARRLQHVVLVRWEARPRAGGCEHLDDEQAVGGEPGREDLVDLARRVARPADLDRDVRGADVRDRAGLRRVRQGLAEGDLGGAADRRHRVGGSRREVHGLGHPVERRRSARARLDVRGPGVDRHAAGDHDERQLPVAGVVAHGRRDRPPAERQELPAGRRGCDRRDRLPQVQGHRWALMHGLLGILRARDASASRRSRQDVWRRGRRQRFRAARRPRDRPRRAGQRRTRRGTRRRHRARSRP